MRETLLVCSLSDSDDNETLLIFNKIGIDYIVTIERG